MCVSKWLWHSRLIFCGHQTTATTTCSICSLDCHRYPFSQVSARLRFWQLSCQTLMIGGFRGLHILFRATNNYNWNLT
jgi:hypothetical protein